MKKNFIILIMLLGVITSLYFCLLPNINYQKLGFISSSSFSLQSLDSELSEEGINKTIILQLCLDYDSYNSNKRINYQTDDLYEFKTYQKEFRNKAKEYHKGNNNRIIRDLKLGNYQELYISTYSPFIDISYDYNYFLKHKNKILSYVSNIDYVSEINIIEDQSNYTGCIDYACNESNALDVYQSRSLTGEGVTVGILENGWVNGEHPDLANTNILFHNSVYSVLGHDDHTTGMALIIAGENGIAPDATILSSYLGGTMNNEIDWMLDNGVDIINMSFGEKGNLGTYSTVSAYADYIAYTYEVIMVACAGNEGEEGDEGKGYISNPGLGHNVITVGTIAGDYTRANSSSWKEGNGPIKPTICTAGGSVYLLDEDNTHVGGTSASTAVCSGLIALLVEDFPSLTYDKGKLLALMSVNSFYTQDANFTEDNGFDDEIGAGLFDYAAMTRNYHACYYLENTSYNADDDVILQQIYIPVDKTIRFACAVTAKATGTVSGTEFTDYDVFLLDNHNNIVAVGNSCNSTIDMLTYTSEYGGYYKLEIYQASDRVVSVDKIGWAYSIR